MTDIRPFRLLANHLRREKETLVARWMQIVSGDTDVEKSASLSRMQLADHLLATFEEICSALEHQDLDVPPVAVEGDAREHRQWRWRQGYRLDKLVRELDVFRQVLTDAVEAYAATDDQFKVSDQGRARYVVDEVISYVTLGSIRERDNKIDEYTGQLQRANEFISDRPCACHSPRNYRRTARPPKVMLNGLNRPYAKSALNSLAC